MFQSVMDLVEIPKCLEGKTLEFKRDRSSPDGAFKTIVAFTNTAGGTLLVGVEDRSRHVRGVPDPLDLKERMASLVPEIEILPWRRMQVLEVHPSPSRPPPRRLTMRAQVLLGADLPSFSLGRNDEGARTAPAVRQTRLTPSIAWRALRRIAWTRDELASLTRSLPNHIGQTVSPRRGIYAGLSNTKFGGRGDRARTLNRL